MTPVWNIFCTCCYISPYKHTVFYIGATYKLRVYYGYVMFNDCGSLKVLDSSSCNKCAYFTRIGTICSLHSGVRWSNFPCKCLLCRVSFLLFRGGLAGSIKLYSDLAFILSTKHSDIPSTIPRTVALGMVRTSVTAIWNRNTRTAVFRSASDCPVTSSHAQADQLAIKCVQEKFLL